MDARQFATHTYAVGQHDNPPRQVDPVLLLPGIALPEILPDYEDCMWDPPINKDNGKIPDDEFREDEATKKARRVWEEEEALYVLEESRRLLHLGITYYSFNSLAAPE